MPHLKLLIVLTCALSRNLNMTSKQSNNPIQTHINNKLRILVLGENGVGKSSIVDLLINRDAEQVPWKEIKKSMSSLFCYFYLCFKRITSLNLVLSYSYCIQIMLGQ